MSSYREHNTQNEKKNRMILKSLYWVFNGLKPLFQKILPDRIWLMLKSALPSQIFKNMIEEAFVKEWQTARTNTPWNNGLKGDQSGINLIGYLQVAKGIGEAARNNIRALSAAQIPHSLIDFETGIPLYLKTEALPAHSRLGEFIFNTNLIHVNPPDMPFLWQKFKNKDLIGRYTIGVWYWELPQFPDEWRFAFDLVDEVWVASQFVLDSMVAKSPVPVVKIPPCIELDYHPAKSRGDFHLPVDKFLFLCAYDVLSTQARKNPRGSIEAFKRAFPKGDPSVGLIIKVINTRQNPLEIKKLQNELRGYSNCYFIEDIYDKSKMNSLLSLVDVYVSLHRSEGFGLIPAEAMSLGKPVIMTQWSGNVDFMTPENSCGVDYRLVPVPDRGADPYLPGQLWAEPDVDHAAFFMQKLVADKEYYSEISKQAKMTIRVGFSPYRIGQLIKTRMKDIGLVS